jgi:hypothetical protein
LGKIWVLLSVALLSLVACGIANATPTNLIEIPTALVANDEDFNVNGDVVYNPTATTTAYDLGVAYGLSEDFEMGVDIQNRWTAGMAPTLNAKWRITDPEKENHFAVGLMDWGFGAATPNMAYAVGTFTDKDDENAARLHLGLYYGVGSYCANDPVSFLAGIDFGGSEWRGMVDWVGGNNPRGVFSAGVGYKGEDEDWGAKLAYQHYNRSKANAVTFQVDWNID